ncbi:MAG: hypothetical protein V4482_01775 [Pseudomonadota bacterium]
MKHTLLILSAFSFLCLTQATYIFANPTGNYAPTCANCTTSASGVSCEKCKKANGTWGATTSISNCTGTNATKVRNCNGVLKCGSC